MCVQSSSCLQEVSMARKTKIVCTLGPSCWGEAGLAALMDAGMNVARFNFSHGDHAGHGEVLQRLRQVHRDENLAALLSAMLLGRTRVAQHVFVLLTAFESGNLAM
jgi:pyruvate kinase